MRKSIFSGFLGLTCILLLAVIVAPAAQTGATDKVADEILKIESRRFAAMLRADTAELDKILAADLIYTHSSGLVETKKEFLASIESGGLKYISIEVDESKARVVGDAAVVNGRAKVKVNSRGQEQSFVIRYIDVYAKRGGTWQMIAWQSTRLP